MELRRVVDVVGGHQRAVLEAEDAGERSGRGGAEQRRSPRPRSPAAFHLEYAIGQATRSAPVRAPHDRSACPFSSG